MFVSTLFQGKTLGSLTMCLIPLFSKENVQDSSFFSSVMFDGINPWIGASVYDFQEFKIGNFSIPVNVNSLNLL